MSEANDLATRMVDLVAREERRAAIAEAEVSRLRKELGDAERRAKAFLERAIYAENCLLEAERKLDEV